MSSSLPVFSNAPSFPLTRYDVQEIREQSPSSPITGWTPQNILNAIVSHDSGNFSDSELLYRAVTKQPFLKAVIDARVQCIQLFPQSLEVPDEAPLFFKNAVKKLEKNWKYVISDMDKWEIVERTNLFGFCIGRITWKLIENQLVPYVNPWTHSNVTYDKTKRCFMVMLENGDQVPAVGYPWVVFHLGGEEPYLKGNIRALGYPLFVLTSSWDRWMYYNDTEATAIKKLQSEIYVKNQLEAQSFVKTAAVLRAGDTVYCPKGWDFNLIRASGGSSGSYKTFQDAIELVKTDVSILFTGNNLNQEIKGGSYAASQTAWDAKTEKSRADVPRYCEPIDEVVLPLWVEANFPALLYPNLSCHSVKIVLDTRNPDEKKVQAEAAASYADSISKVISAVGMETLQAARIDVRELLNRCGIPLLSDPTSQSVNPV